jgi:membrane protein required for colicin V production
MANFNSADWCVIAVISLSTLMSLRRGFVKEALSLATWIAAFIIARTFNQNLQTLLTDSVQNPLFRMAAAFGILFICTLLLGAVISFLVGSLVKMTGLSTTDRLLGMFFGLARGLILTIVAVAIIRITPFAQSDWWKQSVTIEKLQVIEKWSRSVFEDKVKGKVKITSDDAPDSFLES